MNRKPKYRLAWLLCLLLLTGFMVNSISSYFVSRHHVRQTITESSLPLTSDNIYSVIQRDLLQPIFISSMMANDAFLRDWTVAGEKDILPIQRYLYEIVKEYGTVTSFFVSENTRNYYYSDGLLKQVSEDEPRDEWYFRVRQMAEPFEINVDPDLANQDAMTIFINYRVFDFDENFIGAAGTGLTVHRVNSLIEEYEQRFGRQIFFCDRDGNIILSPTTSQLQNYRRLSEVPGISEHADALINKSLDRLIYQRNGDTYFLNSRFVHELDWFLMVEQTEEHLMAPLKDTLFLSILLALLITAVVATISILAIQRHQRHLQNQNSQLLDANGEVERQKQALQENAHQLAKVNESLAALNSEKDDILSIVAHDLRNPLNGIMGFCEEIRLKLPADNDLLHEYLQEIDNGGHKMLELIDDILNVSILSDNKQPLEIDLCNWNALVRDVSRRFEPVALAKNITLIHQLEPSAEIEIQSTVRWLNIILNNLLSNAIKFSPQQSSIQISTLKTDTGCQIQIQDHGPGIKPGEMDKLFLKFVRLTAQPTAGESSTGLGLYIVKKMCDRIGARIEVTSTYGKGSTFTLHHPLRQVKK